MKKTLITILATVLVCCCVVGGTLAYLMAKSTTVTNTFTVGDVSITLTETGATQENGYKQSFKMIPGNNIPKDPTVTVEKGSEACYVFVKIVEEDTKNLISWAIADGWQLVTGQTNVYYREQATLVEATEDVSYPVLLNNQVQVSNDLVKDETTQPTLTFTAYAVQQANLTVAQAWTQAQALG